MGTRPNEEGVHRALPPFPFGEDMRAFAEDANAHPAKQPQRTVDFLRRPLELFLVLMMALALLPLLFVIALAVRVDSPGPVLFRQPRYGKGGNPFICFKFRTMRTDFCDITGGCQTANDDTRVTKVGQFLRRSSLDELPQVLNVLRGDMSLIGPRAHPCGMKVEGRPCDEIVPWYHNRHVVRPGITGWAQVNGSRGAVKDANALARRVELDCHYIRNRSTLLDFRILVMTISTVVAARDAF